MRCRSHGRHGACRSQARRGRDGSDPVPGVHRAPGIPPGPLVVSPHGCRCVRNGGSLRGERPGLDDGASAGTYPQALYREIPRARGPPAPFRVQNLACRRGRLHDQSDGKPLLDTKGRRSLQLSGNEENMTLYSLILFVNVTAVLGLCAALSFEVLSLFHLRRAATVIEARGWIEPVPGLPLVAMGSLLIIFFSGVYLAMRMSAFSLAWPKVTVAALLVIAPFGAPTGRRMRTIRLASADAKAINPDLLKPLQDPFLKVSLGLRIFVFLAIVLLMASKPELWEAISVVEISVVLGLF